MKQEKYKKSVIKLLYAVTLVLIVFFSIAVTGLSINFPVKLELQLVFLVAIVSLVSALILIFKGKYTPAKFLIVIVPIYTVFLISILSKVDGILDTVLVYLAHRFFTLTYLIAPVIFFGLARKKELLVSFLLILPAAILFDFAHEFFGIRLSDLTFDTNHYRFFNFMVILIYSFTIISVLLFQKTSISFKRTIVAQSNEIKARDKTLIYTLSQLNKSIDHAEYIQRTLIPNQKTLNSIFNDMSALYIPKDHVSGDFYFARKKERSVYFGIGDCTGHGVPGAFIASMSIQSILLLLDKQTEPMMPDILLEALRKTALERVVNSETNLTDSMDAGICLYDDKSETLCFSGGFINLILLRNSKEVIEYKGTRCPVGSYPKELPYHLHTIKIEKNDIIYLASDGYFDQFGNDIKSGIINVTKFKKKKFKEFIISICHLSSEEQTKQLKDRFYSWKGEQDQTDDVTVLVNKF